MKGSERTHTYTHLHIHLHKHRHTLLQVHAFLIYCSFSCFNKDSFPFSMFRTNFFNSQRVCKNWKDYLSISAIARLTLSWRRPLSYRNQSIDLLFKSMDWFQDDNGLRYERVKAVQKAVLLSLKILDKTYMVRHINLKKRGSILQF